MLHRHDPAGLIIITQPTHAWISGCLARAWGNREFGTFAPIEEVCLGAEQHDIGWLLWENTPSLNSKTGYPHNFMELPTVVHVGIWSGAKQLALPFGRYAALLISLHGTGLYERFRSWEKSPTTSQVVQKYLEQEYAFQAKLTKDLQHDSHYAPHAAPEVIQRNRSLVGIWDGMSIALCTGLTQSRQFEQVPTASGKTTLTLIPVEDDPTQVKVSPWPFRASEVKLVYEGRRLREQFTDETVMRDIIASAEWVAIATTLKPA